MLLLAAAWSTGFLDGANPFKQQALQLAQNSGVAASAGAILGPFSELAGMVADSLYNALLPSVRSSLHWALLLLTAVIALALYIARNGRGAKGADGRERPCGLLEYLLPRAIYTHPSFRADIGLYLVDRAVKPLWVIAFLGALAPFIEGNTIGAMQWGFGASPGVVPTLGWQLGYGLAMLIAQDFMFYAYHYMMHRTRIGWAIHKVHHSAEVLTPVTRMREHFLENPIDAIAEAIGFGIVGGIFAWVFNGNIVQITVMNVSIYYLLYDLTGNFRHYHVSLRYPRWLEYWLQSPGMHHTHHSNLRQHWDSNLGLVTSIWDRLFGTLYIAERYEETPWGLPPGEQENYRTVRQNLLNPLREIAAILRGRKKPG